MPSITLFVEDFGHEEFITAWLDRFSRETRVHVEIRRYSVRGGHARAIQELGRFVQDVREAHEAWPDLLVVAIDANCQGYARCRTEIETAMGQLSFQVVLAIPDPHIERWILLDSAAFKAVFGKGCEPPDRKCDRDRYKRLLAQAVSQAGVTPLIGGLEHARDIVDSMDLSRMTHKGGDKALNRFLQELQKIFKDWSQS
jgi:Domain of unknown function (DUF4276)